MVQRLDPGCGGATDLILCADLLFMASDAHIGYAPSRIYGLPTTMMWEDEAKCFAAIPANQLALNKLLINQAFENMGLRTNQMLGTFFDGMSRHIEEALQWVEDIDERGFRPVIADRDKPWQDYGSAPTEESS